MTKEKQFKDKLSVDVLANNIQKMHKSTRTKELQEVQKKLPHQLTLLQQQWKRLKYIEQ